MTLFELMRGDIEKIKTKMIILALINIFVGITHITIKEIKLLGLNLDNNSIIINTFLWISLIVLFLHFFVVTITYLYSVIKKRKIDIEDKDKIDDLKELLYQDTDNEIEMIYPVEEINRLKSDKNNKLKKHNNFSKKAYFCLYVFFNIAIPILVAIYGIYEMGNFILSNNN